MSGVLKKKTEENDEMKSKLKIFAMKNFWLEIMPNVYRDNLDRMVRFDTIPENCYYLYLKNEPRIKFLSIEELDDFYKNEKK